jgi:hypothetical protein
VIALINANCFSAQTFNLVVVLIKIVRSGYPIFVTAQYLTLTDFVVLPQFSFAGRTF